MGKNDHVGMMLEAIQENVNIIESMEDQRLEMQQRHEEELERVHEASQEELERRIEEAEKRLEAEKASMVRDMEAFKAECEQALAQERVTWQRRVDDLRIEYQRKCDESISLVKAQAEKDIADVRAKCERQLAEAELSITGVKADSAKEIAESRAQCERDLAEARAQCERVEAEKVGLAREMGKFGADTQRKMAEEQANMERILTNVRAHYDKTIAEEKSQLERTIADEKAKLDRTLAEEKKISERTIKQEKDQMATEIATVKRDFELKMADEKASLAKQMAEARKEVQAFEEQKVNMEKEVRRMEQEKRDMSFQMAETRAIMEMTLKDEKAAAERTLEVARRQTEEQLQAERQVTAHIMQAIRELPPLQAAMELGDLHKLEQELSKMKSEPMPERFGDCKGVVDAVVRLARERLLIWREVDHTVKDVINQVERLPGNLSALVEHCQRLFRALKDAQLTKMDLRRTDPKATEHICQVLLAWQSRAMAHSNTVQKAIVMKVATAPSLGAFDFADLDICLRLVDRAEEEKSNNIFLSRALVLVQDPQSAPKDLRPLLAHLETMLFFLKYTKMEDLGLTHMEFKRQEPKLDPLLVELFRWAAQSYPPGCELAHFDEKQSVMDPKDVDAVLREIRSVPRHEKGGGLGHFREIFHQWALAMRSKFDLLVLPHHTQVVCLMIFRRFLELARDRGSDLGPRSLIAQVGTGEGKSMIVATLAIYVVVVMRKKVHVVVDDETLLERDYCDFKPVFDSFSVPDGTGKSRQLTSLLCVSEDRLTNAGKYEDNRHMGSRVDAKVDIVYCEAKHVQSFYASIARGDADFSGYNDRVLILDEVDALVIDEEPNEAFVYPNQELCMMATGIAQALKRGRNSPSDLTRFMEVPHPAAKRVCREMQSEWKRGEKLKEGEDFIYANDAGRYCGLHSGRANANAWSLALECRNFQDGFSREILFQERLFVMSRPRVFRKYHRILGLSGSIGSEAERSFLKDTYGAAFFEVPPFLKTCRGSHFHEPVPMPLGAEKRAVYLEPTAEAQSNRVAEVALDARERVPVLVIAKDRGHCEQLVDSLRAAARMRGLSGQSDDVVRSLARTLYEADPQRWKENLNRATLPIVEDADGRKTWRITVTDPRGGRGTDYRVDDQTVDERGGLLLIPTSVPPAQREWTQFLGRTARQDRHGQFCAVLCSMDYDKLAVKHGQQLPVNGGMKIVETILSWGDREVGARIRASSALYNCGVRVNELCEEVFGRRSEALKNPEAREIIVDVCQKLRWMSIKEVDAAFSSILNPADVATEAVDLGRPQQPASTAALSIANFTRSIGGRKFSTCPLLPSALTKAASSSTLTSQLVAAPKVVIFCLDKSISMMSQDTGTRGVTRFQLCVTKIREIFKEQVKDQDLVGVVAFGAKMETVFPPTAKAEGSARLESKLISLRPDSAGGTCFFDAVAQCLQLLNQHPLEESHRWLVCLTDGDDLGSRKENSSGQIVTSMLQAGIANLNMMMITVGRLEEKNTRVIDSWVDRVVTSGGVGQHIDAKDAAHMAEAFEVVAEILAADVGGQIEC